MSGTDALSDLDEILNTKYNEYVEDDDYDSAEIIDIVRCELDKIYYKYFWKGD